MDSLFKISKKGLCGISVTGLELDNDEYLNKSNVIISTRNYTYSQSVTINVLEKVNAQQEETLYKVNIVKHVVDCIDESDFLLNEDGLYNVTHIILPTQEWFNNVMLHSPESFNAYYGVYFYDENRETFNKYEDGTLVEVSLEEILEINALPPLDASELTTTIIKGTKNTFSICKLKDCFYKICRQLLQAYPVKCPDKSNDLEQLQYYRDIIWMALNVMKYLLEKNQVFEAQRILEEITYCGSICNNIENTDKKYSSSCGCSQR